MLEGGIYWQEGDLNKAKAAFEQSIKFYDALTYDEPEPIPFSPRHWYGALLLEMEKYNEAKLVYEKELEHHPNNGWSLYGIQQALKAQGKSDSTIDARFKESWKRSDTWIRGSKL